MTMESEATHWYSQAVKSCGKVARILSLPDNNNCYQIVSLLLPTTIIKLLEYSRQ